MKKDNNLFSGAGTAKQEKAGSIDFSFERMCELEGLSLSEGEAWMDGLMEETEQQINSYEPMVNHLTVLNRQLRGAAAVFLLVVSGGLLMSCVKVFHLPASDNTTYYGAYELASGDKLVP